MESSQGRVLVVSCSSYLSTEDIVRGMDIVVLMDIFSILTLEKYSCKKSSLMIRVVIAKKRVLLLWCDT